MEDGTPLNMKENMRKENPHTEMGLANAAQPPGAGSQRGTLLMRGDCAAPPLARTLWCFSAESKEYFKQLLERGLWVF